jgi:hypothetical protein
LGARPKVEQVFDMDEDLVRDLENLIGCDR